MPNKWVTKDGKELLVSEMGDDHILNIINAYREGRLVSRVVMGNVSGPPSECWADVDEIPYQEDKKYIMILREAKKRSLDVGE